MKDNDKKLICFLLLVLSGLILIFVGGFGLGKATGNITSGVFGYARILDQRFDRLELRIEVLESFHEKEATR